MRIAIVGAGAMGGLFGVRLALSGQEVSFIEVSEEAIHAIRQDGFTLADEAGTRTARVPAGSAASFTEPFDLIVVFTKGFHTASAVQSVAHLVGPSTWALSVQNGLGNAEIIASVVPRQRVIVGMTNYPADLKTPGVVHSHGEGQVRIWSMSGEACPEVREIAAAFDRAGLACSADPRVQEAIWEKVAFNAALNSICTVTHCTVDQLGLVADGQALAFAVVEEVLSVAWAMGIAADLQACKSHVADAVARHAGHKPSMLQDVLAGRRTEIETINGAVVAAADARGIAVPCTRALLQLVRLIQARPREAATVAGH